MNGPSALSSPTGREPEDARVLRSERSRIAAAVSVCSARRDETASIAFSEWSHIAVKVFVYSPYKDEYFITYTGSLSQDGHISLNR